MKRENAPELITMTPDIDVQRAGTSGLTQVPPNCDTNHEWVIAL
jgi:hypothetical protein